MSYRLKIYLEDETSIEFAEEYDTIDEVDAEMESLKNAIFPNNEGEFLGVIGGKIVK